MSHFTVLVIGDNIEEQLQSFQEDEGTGDDAKWDWWVVGGRWTGFFKLKAGASGELGEGGTGHKLGHVPYPEGNVADRALKGDIDFDGMRDEVEEKARKTYRAAHEIIAGRPIPSWNEIRERHGDGNFRAARDEYLANPVVVALRGCDDVGDIAELAVTEDEFAQSARDNAIRTFAVLKDGVWYEQGEMGGWCIVSNEKDDESWVKEFWALLDGLPDDTLLTVVDCHI